MSIDLRSLAAFRISLGILVTLNCLDRIRNSDELFSGDCALPVATRLVDLSGDGRGSDFVWSIFFLTSNDRLISGFLIVGIIFGTLLALGCFTRLSTIVSWVIVASIRSRIPYAGDAGDALLTLLLFWSAFLPCGRYLSVDSFVLKRRRNRCNPSETSVFSGASIGILLQVLIVYWMAALLKIDPSWRVSGTALSEALGLKSLTRPTADILNNYPSLTQFLSRFTIILEETAPIVAILTPYTSKWRSLAPLMMIFFHLGIFTFFTLGLFPMTAISAWIVFLPGIFWDGFQKLLFRLSFRSQMHPARITSEIIGQSLHPASSIIRHAIPSLALGLVIWWNVSTLPLPGGRISMPLILVRLSFALHLNQHWSLFAPKVNTREGLFRIEVEASDGTFYLLSWNGDVAPTSEVSLRNYYPTARTRQYLTYLFHSRKPHLINAYANWLRGEFQKRSGKSISDIRIFFLLSDNSYPEDLVSEIEIYPIGSIGSDGLAVFPQDRRRN